MDLFLVYMTNDIRIYVLGLQLFFEVDEGIALMSSSFINLQRLKVPNNWSIQMNFSILHLTSYLFLYFLSLLTYSRPCFLFLFFSTM
jgi:hypothetical protein